MSDWPDGAADLVQAVADTKLLLSHRYAEWMLGGPALEDDIAGASAAQDEIGHVRQLFRLLEGQGREEDWLYGEREPAEVANAASLDAPFDSWLSLVAAADTAERAAWFLLDAVVHEDFDGLLERIGQDEYFHLEHLDGRIESLADEEPDELQAALEAHLPDALALLGPATLHEDSDPLLEAGFTDRSVAELRDAYRGSYEDLLDGTAVSLDGVDWDAPEPDDWDDVRRRVDGGGVDRKSLDELRGAESQEFVIE